MSIADSTMIGRSARALTSRASVRPSIRGISMSMIRRSGQAWRQPAQRLVAVARGLDLVAVHAELIGEDDEQVGVVVNDQDPRRRDAVRSGAAVHGRRIAARIGASGPPEPMGGSAQPVTPSARDRRPCRRRRRAQVERTRRSRRRWPAGRRTSSRPSRAPVVAQAARGAATSTPAARPVARGRRDEDVDAPVGRDEPGDAAAATSSSSASAPRSSEPQGSVDRDDVRDARRARRAGPRRRPRRTGRWAGRPPGGPARRHDGMPRPSPPATGVEADDERRSGRRRQRRVTYRPSPVPTSIDDPACAGPSSGELSDVHLVDAPADHGAHARTVAIGSNAASDAPYTGRDVRPPNPPLRAPPAAFHPWDPRTPDVARDVARLVASARPGSVVEHVGSSPVPGLPGKNVVDLGDRGGSRRHPRLSDALLSLGFGASRAARAVPADPADAHRQRRPRRHAASGSTST